jgi:hypothetical protein
VAFCFVQKTYSQRALNPCNHQSMARSGNSGRDVLKRPEVTFSVAIRPSTPAQLEAGKRLFKRLIDRAQSNMPDDNSKSP